MTGRRVGTAAADWPALSGLDQEPLRMLDQALFQVALTSNVCQSDEVEHVRIAGARRHERECVPAAEQPGGCPVSGEDDLARVRRSRINGAVSR